MIEDQVRVVRSHVLDMSEKGHFERIRINGAFIRGVKELEVVGNFDVEFNSLKFVVRAGIEPSHELERLIENTVYHKPFEWAGLRLISKDMFCGFKSRTADWRFNFEVLNWAVGLELVSADRPDDT